MLKAVEAIAEKHGIKLDMGTVKPVSEYVSGPSDGPAPEPMDIAPRVIAHLAHRIPGVRKIGKLSENKGAKSGVVTDTLTLIAQLLERNEELVMDKGLEAVGLVVNPNASQGHAQQAPPMRDVVVVDDVPLVQPEQ